MMHDDDPCDSESDSESGVSEPRSESMIMRAAAADCHGDGALRLVITGVSLQAAVAEECSVRAGHSVFLSPFLDEGLVDVGDAQAQSHSQKLPCVTLLHCTDIHAPPLRGTDTYQADVRTQTNTHAQPWVLPTCEQRRTVFSLRSSAQPLRMVKEQPTPRGSEPELAASSRAPARLADAQTGDWQLCSTWTREQFVLGMYD